MNKMREIIYLMNMMFSSSLKSRSLNSSSSQSKSLSSAATFFAEGLGGAFVLDFFLGFGGIGASSFSSKSRSKSSSPSTGVMSWLGEVSPLSFRSRSSFTLSRRSSTWRIQSRLQYQNFDRRQPSLKNVRRADVLLAASELHQGRIQQPYPRTSWHLVCFVI